MITDAFNDLGCRLELNTAVAPCTQNQSGFAFASPLSTVQFCTISTVNVFWRFPFGDTLLTMRWRDQGNLVPSAASSFVSAVSKKTPGRPAAWRRNARHAKE
jgi:hypothetical protein